MKWILFIFSFSSLCYAGPTSIKELIERSNSYSPQIKGELFQLSASESAVRQSRLLSNPSFSYQGGVLKSGQSSGAVTDLTLNQPIPWYGKRQQRIEAQEFLLKLSELSKDEVRIAVAHRVYTMSAELAALQELERHYSERKRRFNLIEKSLHTRPQVSPKQKVDRDLIESQIMLMEKSMLDLLAKKEAILWELKIFTNSDVESVLFSWKTLPLGKSKDQYLSLLDSSPKSVRWKLEDKLATNKIEQARYEARPDIIVGLNYRNENVYPSNHFYQGQVSIVIPILDHGQHSMQLARAEQRKMTAIHAFQRDQYISLIHQYYAQFEASMKAINVFHMKNLREIESKFFDAEKSFKKGLIDAITFLQIDAQVHENIDQIYLTRVEYLTALSNLEQLVGKPPEL